MPEGSSILRETGCRLKNQPLHRSRLRTNDFSVKTRCRSGFARREIFRSGKASARSCAPMIFPSRPGARAQAYRVYVKPAATPHWRKSCFVSAAEFSAESRRPRRRRTACTSRSGNAESAEKNRRIEFLQFLENGLHAAIRHVAVQLRDRFKRRVH